MLLAGLGERNELYIALFQEQRTSSAEVNLTAKDSAPWAGLSKILTIRSLSADWCVQPCVRIEVLPVAPFLPLPCLCPRMRFAQGYGA
jgi:hypothetical protein